jgi:sugar lactone lactonase YvrE
MPSGPRDDNGLTVFRREQSVLVESIFWDATAELVRWTDITLGLVKAGRIDGPDDGEADTSRPVPPPLASFQPAPNAGFIAALGDRIVRLDETGAITSTITDIAHRHDGMRMNEGKCDPYGSFVAGSMNLAGDEPDGRIYRVHGDGSAEVLVEHVSVANGFEWSDDGRTFFFTDTGAETVYRADYTPDGPLEHVQPFLTGHASDGLALDTDGCFWNGVYGAGQVLQWTPDGRVARVVDIPAPNVTSVAFGGPDRSTLFVGTARENLTEDQLEAWPLSGSIFAIRPGATGRPVNTYGSAVLTTE